MLSPGRGKVINGTLAQAIVSVSKYELRSVVIGMPLTSTRTG